MGFWSGITSSVGGLVKNTVKIGVGYAAGEAIGNMINETDDPAKQGAAGLLGIAGIYAIPAAGSKMMDFVKNHVVSVNDPSVSNKTSCWKAIGKTVAAIAGGTFVISQAGKWISEYKDANDNVYNPGKDEYLDLGTASATMPVSRTGDELTENIQTESESVIPEMSY